MSTEISISGLLVSSNALDIISNNIANASTVGFKSSTPSFCDLVQHSPSAYPSQGSGARIANITPNFNNGTLINTGRDLDISINQNGFFRVMDPTGLIYYTRNGQFSFDSNKNIVNMQGMYLIGESENVYRDPENNVNYLEPINFKNIYKLKSKPTTLITFHPVLTENEDNPDNERTKYNTTLDIYDQDNKSQKIDITFKKKNNESHTWIAHFLSQNSEKLSKKEKIDHVFELKFNSDGQLISPNTPYQIVKGILKNDVISIDFTGTVERKVNNNNDYFMKAEQNGYPEGILKTFNILNNGAIIGTYSNQQKVEIGQIILANFVNPEKLRPEGSNLWSLTAEAGKEKIGTPGSLGFGILTNKTLEASNVDLNKELINMIIAQRNYQSNAQALKAEDKIISTLVNLR